jgi:chemotaxis protein methyltransferase CheR
VISDDLRKHVSFTSLNLASEVANDVGDIGPFDLILCRNVMIYFDNPTVARLEQRLFDALTPGGWLLTGPSDPLLGQRAPFEVIVLPHGVCYRRPVAPLFAPRAPKRSEPGRPKSVAPPRVAPSTPPDPVRSIESVREEAAAAFERAEYANVIAIANRQPEDTTLAALEVRATWNLDGARLAERVCTLALARHSLSAELHYLHAMMLMESKRMQDALQAVRRALYLDRTLTIAHFAHGAILERLNDLEGARRAYRNTYEGCKKHSPDDVVALGDGIVAEGLCNAASHALKELTKRCPV